MNPSRGFIEGGWEDEGSLEAFKPSGIIGRPKKLKKTLSKGSKQALWTDLMNGRVKMNENIIGTKKKKKVTKNIFKCYC